MTMDTPNHIPDIPQEKFKFVQLDQEIVDSAFETEPIGYFKDALIRLRKNKASVVAFYIILVISSLPSSDKTSTPYVQARSLRGPICLPGYPALKTRHNGRNHDTS